MEMTLRRAWVLLIAFGGCCAPAPTPLPASEHWSFLPREASFGVRVDPVADADFLRLLKDELYPRPPIEVPEQDPGAEWRLQPYIRFVREHAGTRAETRALLEMATCGQIDWDWAQAVLERISTLEDLTWEPLIARQQLFDLKLRREEWARGKFMSTEYERLWEAEREWYEQNEELSRQLDRYLAEDPAFRARTPLVIQSFEIHNWINRAHSWYVRRNFAECRRLLGEIETRFRSHPTWDRTFIANWFTFD